MYSKENNLLEVQKFWNPVTQQYEHQAIRAILPIMRSEKEWAEEKLKGKEIKKTKPTNNQLLLVIKSKGLK